MLQTRVSVVSGSMHAFTETRDCCQMTVNTADSCQQAVACPHRCSSGPFQVLALCSPARWYYGKHKHTPLQSRARAHALSTVFPCSCHPPLGSALHSLATLLICAAACEPPQETSTGQSACLLHDVASPPRPSRHLFRTSSRAGLDTCMRARELLPCAA